jgi:hypothetical protein
MNGVFTFVLLLVAIGACVKICQSYLDHKREKGTSDEEIESTLAKIEILEERVRVLERIITENPETRYDLKKKIDNL